jgi:hypothetical protein
MEWASDRYLLSADIGPAIERTRPYIEDWWRTGGFRSEGQRRAEADYQPAASRLPHARPLAGVSHRSILAPPGSAAAGFFMSTLGQLRPANPPR